MTNKSILHPKPPLTGKKTFDLLTQMLEGIGILKDYTFTEFVMPDGEIQRWWVGNDEHIIIAYKDDRHNPK